MNIAVTWIGGGDYLSLEAGSRVELPEPPNFR
jgi:hypothetical protein